VQLAFFGFWLGGRYRVGRVVLCRARQLSDDLGISRWRRRRYALCICMRRGWTARSGRGGVTSGAHFHRATVHLVFFFFGTFAPDFRASLRAIARPACGFSLSCRCGFSVPLFAFLHDFMNLALALGTVGLRWNENERTLLPWFSPSDVRGALPLLGGPLSTCFSGRPCGFRRRLSSLAAANALAVDLGNHGVSRVFGTRLLQFFFRQVFSDRGARKSIWSSSLRQHLFSSSLM